MIRRKYPALSSPLRVGNVTLRNRMISAPMGFPDITPEGHVTERACAFYELRARGGAAVVTLSEAIVHIATGKSHSKHINLQDREVLAGLTEAARAIKRHGALANIELSHGGKYALVDRIKGAGEDVPKRYGPSSERLAGGGVVEEMPREMIREIVEAFGQGAALAKRAGFDMVFVHGGHGWLIQQFFSPATNKRSDEYGCGSLENRARFALEVVDSIRTAVGEGFPIEFRMSGEEYIPGGYGVADAIELARLLEDRIDLLHVSTGSHENSFSRTHPSMFVQRGTIVPLAAEIKKHVKVPVACIGALNDPEQMEEIISSGQADAVEMARALLADPWLPRKVMLGRDREILKCIRCFTCLAERVHTQTRICSINPVIGREFETRFSYPPAKRKKVLVAGGGPGGMQTAITAAERGHRVILCEKRQTLGGALNFARAIPFKHDLFALIDTFAARMEKVGVEVRLGTEVTEVLVEAEAPDVLVLAVGATPIVPTLPGMDESRVVLANDLAGAADSIGERVVMLGGGLVGCEAAVHLARQGKFVSIVEMQPDIALEANVRQRPILLDMIAGLNIAVRVGTRGIGLEDGVLICVDAENKEVRLEADTVVCAVGQRPLREVVDRFLDAAPEVVQVGDCVKAESVTQALRRGYWAGLDIGTL